MGRFTKNHMLEIGATFLGLGVIMSLLGYLYQFMDQPTWLGWYGGALESIPGATANGYNLLIMILGTLFVIGGGWTFGEQMSLRRRFERLIDTSKKSEFVSNRRRLMQISQRLPDDYRARIKAKEEEIRSS